MIASENLPYTGPPAFGAQPWFEQMLRKGEKSFAELCKTAETAKMVKPIIGPAAALHQPASLTTLTASLTTLTPSFQWSHLGYRVYF